MKPDCLEQEIENGQTSSKVVTNKPDSKAAAKKRTKEILKEGSNGSGVKAGTVIGGNSDDWFYYHVPESGDRARLEEKLTRLGYEVAPDSRIAGVYGGRVWRVPVEIRKRHLETRKANLERRNI